MKTVIIMSIIATLSLNTIAQNKNLIDISHIQLGKNDSFVYLSFDVTVGRNSTKEYKLITPTIVGESESRDFASIGIESRRAKLISSRNPNKNKNIHTYTYNNGESFIYADTMMYEDWMNGGKLVLNYIDNACSQIADSYTEVKIKEISLPVDAKPATPKIATKTWHIINISSVACFEQGKADLEYKPDNYSFLSEVSDTISRIVFDDESQLTNIEITGNASPEGVLSSNVQLSCKRANAVKTHLMENIPELRDSMFTLNCGGENWDGLQNMILASDMPYRDEVLEILTNTTLDDDGTARKNALRKLRSGILYKYMLNYMYPELRNVNKVTITYFSIKREDAEEQHEK